MIDRLPSSRSKDGATEIVELMDCRNVRNFRNIVTQKGRVAHLSRGIPFGRSWKSHAADGVGEEAGEIGIGAK